MPARNFTVADVVNHGVSHPAIAKAVKLDLTAEQDPVIMATAFKKAATLATPNKGLLVVKPTIFKTPLATATALINAKYKSLGGTKGFLGKALTPVKLGRDRKGYFRHFKGGSIYWSWTTGAHEIHGLIRAKWSALKGELGLLGYPTTDETVGRDLNKEGRFNHFQRGSIYWHPKTGAHEVHGAIRTKYLEFGAESSVLGYPRTDETSTPDRIGRFNHFQRGSVYYTPYTGAHEIHGLIRQKWAEGGWERNAGLGYPITDERIPDRRLGFTFPLVTRKPLVAVPNDVFHLPNLVATPGMAAPKPTAKVLAATPTMTLTPNGLTTSRSATALKAVKGVKLKGNIAINPSILVFIPTGESQAAKESGPSQNRYVDFENGLLFWKRGEAAASQLLPWVKTKAGAKMHLTTQEAINISGSRTRTALNRMGGLRVQTMTFAGTTRYSFDGTGVHNRNHRVNILLRGKGALHARTVTVEARYEISFDPMSYRVVGYLTKWFLLSSTGFGTAALKAQLHTLLDPLLWVKFPVFNIPKQGKVFLPVLSVKTMNDGNVKIFIEP